MQREFVWKDEQITALFDSAMRGYPIGTLLLWRVSGTVAKKWRWFRCHTDLHREHPLSRPSAAPLGAKVDAVLDGQQRLTAFNIGVYGSVTVARSEGAAAQKRFLHVDVAHSVEEPEPGAARYRFSFRVPDAATVGGEKWIRVSDASHLASRVEARSLIGRGAAPAEVAVLERLRRVLQTEQVIAWQVVEDDDLDAVLNIFIRANTKGTQLRYDDMLLAIANAIWKRHDANDVIKTLRTELDRNFRLPITQTRIMRAALVVSGAPQVGFRASNLTRARLRAMDNDWDGIERSIWVATKTLSRFGFTRRTLTAENVLIPIATYAHHRGLDERWVDAGKNAKDLERIRRFVFARFSSRTSGTGSVDAVQILCRDVIAARPRQAAFPLAELSSAVAASRLGKRIDFTEEDIEQLLATRYRDRRALLLLTALFPDAARQGWLAKDHVYPKSKFTSGGLRVAGLPMTRLTEMRDLAEQLPNLCLLSTEDNQWWKRARPPAHWLDEVAKQAGPSQRASRIRNLDLQKAPSTLAGFDAFWDRRRERVRRRLLAVLR